MNTQGLRVRPAVEDDVATLLAQVSQFKLKDSWFMPIGHRTTKETGFLSIQNQVNRLMHASRLILGTNGGHKSKHTMSANWG